VTGVALDAHPRRRRLAVPTAWRQPLAIVGVVIALAWVVIAIFAPLIAPHDRSRRPRRRRSRRRCTTSSAPTSSGETSSAE
jgi:ABC-type dipeptide/oligopeptide/nickel transport system permease subunit